MKKKTKKVLIISGIIIGILLVITLFGGFNFKSLATVPLDCLDGSLCKTTVPPFSCPLDVDFCQVKGEISCNTQTGSNPVVIARTTTTTDSLGRRLWYALANDYGNLESWCPQTSIDSTSVTRTKNVQLPYGGDAFIGTYSGKTYLLITKPGETNKYFRYESGSCSADVSPSAKYGCNNNELCSGSTTLYSCNSLLRILKVDNTIKSSENLVYSSSTSGNKQSSQYRLEKGEKADFLSGTYSDSKIYYNTFKITTSCSKSQCNGDNTGFFNCTSGTLESQVNYCDVDKGFVCDTSIGSCSFPLNKEIKIVDSSGTAKSGFNPSENMYITSKITSSLINSANVKFIIYPYGSNTPLNTYEINNYNFNNPSSISTSIVNPGNSYVGQQFYVVVAVTYNGKTIYFGKDNQEYSFRIAPSLSCNVQFMSNINGQTRTTLFKNYPVNLKIFTSVSDQASPVEKVNLNLRLNTGNGIVPITLTSANLKSSGIASSDNSVWEYVYEFTPTNTGSLDSEISVEKSSVTQSCNVQSTTVKALTVTPSFTNIAKYTYKCVQKDSPIDLTIEIKDDLGNYINPSDLKLKVIFSSTTLQNDITNLLQKTDVGKYHFTYNFPQIGSTYFQLGSEFFSGINTGALDVLTSCQLPDCVQNSDCTDGKICQNNTCIDDVGPNWIKYVIIILGFLVGIVVLVIIIKVVKKPKQQVYTGLGGL